MVGLLRARNQRQRPGFRHAAEGMVDGDEVLVRRCGRADLQRRSRPRAWRQGADRRPCEAARAGCCAGGYRRWRRARRSVVHLVDGRERRLGLRPEQREPLGRSSWPRSGITPFGERASAVLGPADAGSLRAGDAERAADRAEDFVAGAGRAAHLPAPCALPLALERRPCGAGKSR